MLNTLFTVCTTSVTWWASVTWGRWRVDKLRVREGFLIGGNSTCGDTTFSDDRVRRKCVPTRKTAIHIHAQSSGTCLAVGKGSIGNKVAHCRFRGRVAVSRTRRLLRLYRKNIVSGHHCLIGDNERVFRISRFCNSGSNLMVTRIRLRDRARACRGPSFVSHRIAKSGHFCGSRLLAGPFYG